MRGAADAFRGLAADLADGEDDLERVVFAFAQAVLDFGEFPLFLCSLGAQRRETLFEACGNGCGRRGPHTGIDALLQRAGAGAYFRGNLVRDESGNSFPEVVQLVHHGGAEHQHLFEELALDFLNTGLGGSGAGGALRAQRIDLERHSGFHGGDAAIDLERLLLEPGVHGADDGFEDLVIQLRGWGGGVLDTREALLDFVEAAGQGMAVGRRRGLRGTAHVLSESHPHRTEGQATPERDGKRLPD